VVDNRGPAADVRQHSSSDQRDHVGLNRPRFVRHSGCVKPRSIVLDLCGDYVRYRGGGIGLGAMTDLLGTFDVGADNARVVMSRLRRDGFFDTVRDGRMTRYVITERTMRILDEGRERIFTRNAETWDGNWHLVIYQVPETARAIRERLRTGLAWLGFGPLAPSTWLSAHDRRALVDELFSEPGHSRVDQLTAQTGSLTSDRAMAARCWDLPRLAASYLDWLSQWRRQPTTERSDRMAFVRRTSLVHSYRKFPFSDPDLPAELLPKDWPGATAHERFLELYRGLQAGAERCYDDVAGRRLRPSDPVM